MNYSPFFSHQRILVRNRITKNVVATVLNEFDRIDYNVNSAGVRYLSYMD